MHYADRYVMLVSSLPHLGPLFRSKQTPLSRMKLQERLRLLREEDAAQLAQIEAVMHWSHHPIERTDAQIMAQTVALLEKLDSDTLREVVRFRMEQRTIVAALRRRRLGLDAPPRNVSWGMTPWLDHIVRHWRAPYFALEHVFPWIKVAVELMQKNDLIGLERLLMARVWERCAQAAQTHHFDFEAVVLYVLRWNIIDRWTRYEGHLAAQRFESLVAEGLGGYAKVFAALGVE